MSTLSVAYRRALRENVPAILTLQSANHVANLSEAERKQGFLSARFTPEQIGAIAGDLGVMLALTEDRVAGFLCAFRRDFHHRVPVVEKMLGCYDDARFGNRPLSSFRSYIYGPVCVDRDYRGRGLLRGLYEAQKRDLAGRFELGVAFVARGNPHSLQVHVAGLGMSEVGEFELEGNGYIILAFALSET